MRQSFLLIILFTGLTSNATNDTLTRAQVYNFNVGDTFDYETESIQVSQDDPINYIHSISFSRYVVTQVQSSQTGDSLFIVEQVYQNSQGDTLSFQDSTTLIIDSI